MSKVADTVVARLDYLDGLRGWASVMVLLSHAWGQFARHNVELYSSLPMRLISDGHFAVLVFFVLSGTALSLRFTRHPQPVVVGRLVIARYVRLVVPIAAVSLIVCTLMKAGAYGDAEVAAAAHSPMLLGPRIGLDSSFADALRFSAFDVLFRYDAATSFNGSLWTMPIEFLGSMLIYALLLGLSLVPALRRPHRMAIGIALGLVLVLAGKPLAACFCGGYAIAELLFAPQRALLAGGRLGAMLVAIGAVLVIGHHEQGDICSGLLAFGTVLSVACTPYLRALFSSRLSRWLGTISFPLYLIHAAVIGCGGHVFVALMQHGLAPAPATHLTLALMLPACLLAAWVLMPIEHLSIRASRAVGNVRLRPKALAGAS